MSNSTSQHTAEVKIVGRTDGVSQKLKEVADGTEKVKRASEAAGAAQDEWGDKLDRIDGKMAAFAGGISKITGLLGAGGLVSMLGGAASSLGEMAERAAQVTAANQALKISIAGAREATMGLVSDYDLTVAANKAMQLGVVKTGEEFARLTQTAAKLGMAMGQDASKSVDDLTTALGRGSVEILDNLGIQLKLSDAHEAYAQRLGKTADQLDEVEKKQAFLTIGLEKAQEAADKSNVSLDNQAVKIAALSARWQNFTDQVSGVVVDGLAAAMEGVDGVTDSIFRLQEEAIALHPELAETRQQAQELGGITLELLTKFNDATGATDRLREASEKLTKALADEQAYLREQAELAGTLIGPAPPPGSTTRNGNTVVDPPKSRGRRRAAAGDVDPMLRQVSLDASIGASNDIANIPVIEARNEAFQREIELREDRIALAEHEQELAQMQADAGLLEADQVEEMARRKYTAEQELLDFQIQAASTREEILDLELAKRRRATQESQRLMVTAQAAEIKALQQRREKYEGFALTAADALGTVALAGIAAAEGQEYAGRKAVAAIATSIRDQMILTSLKEFALAIASAASFNFVGAAAHAAAGVQAGVVAGVAGGLGAAVNASIPSPPDTSSPPSTSTSSGGSSSSGGGSSSSSGGDGDDDGVPTSYNDGGLYSKRPSKMGGSGKGSSGGNVVLQFNGPVIGGTPTQIGMELKRWIRDAEGSEGSVR